MSTNLGKHERPAMSSSEKKHIPSNHSDSGENNTRDIIGGVHVTQEPV
jgi:hypothetical protein